MDEEQALRRAVRQRLSHQLSHARGRIPVAADRGSKLAESGKEGKKAGGIAVREDESQRGSVRPRESMAQQMPQQRNHDRETVYISNPSIPMQDPLPVVKLLSVILRKVPSILTYHALAV